MVASLELIKVSQDDLQLESLPVITRKALLVSSNLEIFDKSDWYLAGGTALALQCGHRQSVDLDFFINQADFTTEKLEKDLVLTKKWQTTYQEKGTLYGSFLKAKMSFIAYPFFKPSKKRLAFNKIKILHSSDIAVMKIIAISQRGKKRDFIDLYWYCQNYEPLENILLRVIKQYPGQEANMPFILKSIVYFEDAESEPMPKIFFKVDWNGVKRYFRKVVPEVTKKLLFSK